MDRKLHILCTCEHGNNRSVHFAHILKYVIGFETMTVGLAYHSEETLDMMFKWADVIIVVEDKMLAMVPEKYRDKIKFYNIGEDKYPRPFNKELYQKAKEIMFADPITNEYPLTNE